MSKTKKPRNKRKSLKKALNLELKPLRVIRRLSQLLFFLLLVFFVVSGFCNFILPGLNYTLGCPFGALQISLASLRFAPLIILSAATLFLITIVLGRVFCGWACPIGFILSIVDTVIDKVKDWTGRNLRRLPLGFLKNPNNKYMAVVGAVLVSPILRRSAFCPICPVGALCRSSGAQETNLRLETALIPLVGLMSFSAKRFWCRNLCPIGGFLGILSCKCTKRVYLPMEKCLECGACERVCPVGVPILEETREKLKQDPEVVAILEEIEQPDLLNRPQPFKRLPEEVQEILLEKGPKYDRIPPRECIQCHECVLACPVVQREGHPKILRAGNKSKRVTS